MCPPLAKEASRDRDVRNNLRPRPRVRINLGVITVLFSRLFLFAGFTTCLAASFDLRKIGVISIPVSK